MMDFGVGVNKVDTYRMKASRALFCTITQQPGHGGIARVSDLLWRVMLSQPGQEWRLAVASPAGGSLTTIDKLSFLVRVAWQQIRGDCDFVFFDHLGLARVQGLVPRRYRRPYGIFLHGVEAWTPLGKSRLEVLRGAVIRVANSFYTARRIGGAHPDCGNITVCHLSLPPETSPIDSRDEELLAKIRPDSVLIVGRMAAADRRKGHDQLLRAWPLVRKSVTDAQLLIVGEGNDRERLQNLAGEFNAGSGILFTGKVSEGTLQAIYARAAVFAMPSNGEGFGLVYLEAMAHGLACIASTNDAAGEIVVDGETGFLVEQEDTQLLAQRIIVLLQNQDLRRQFGQRGQERQRRRFSYEHFEGRMSKLLTKLGTGRAIPKG